MPWSLGVLIPQHHVPAVTGSTEGCQAAGVSQRQIKNNALRSASGDSFFRFWVWDGSVFRYFNAYLPVCMVEEAERKEQDLGAGHWVKSEITLFGNGVGIVQLCLSFKTSP